jgi:hypothetical protein
MDLISRKLNTGIILLDNAAQEERKQKIAEKKATPGYVPTPANFPPNMISMCRRRIVYHLLRLPVIKITDPQLLRIFDNGTSCHERVTKYLAASMPGDIRWDYKIENDRVKGYIDVIMKFSEEEYDEIDPNKDVPGRPFIVGEIKSANGNTCYWIERRNEPSKKFVQQLQLYMHITGIHKGVVIVERKDDQAIWPFYVDYDPVMVEELLEKVKFCLDCSDTRIIPKRDGTRRSNPCWSSEDKAPMCPYYDICWSETEGRDLIDMVATVAAEDPIELELEA